MCVLWGRTFVIAVAGHGETGDGARGVVSTGKGGLAGGQCLQDWPVYQSCYRHELHRILGLRKCSLPPISYVTSVRGCVNLCPRACVRARCGPERVRNASVVYVCVFVCVPALRLFVRVSLCACMCPPPFAPTDGRQLRWVGA